MGIPTYYAGGSRPLMPEDITAVEERIIEKIIIKSSTIPTASAYTVGEVRQYVGTSDNNYTHGYIYECVAGDIIYTGTVTFQSATISGTIVTCDGDVFANFVATEGTNPEYIVSGTMTYDIASSLWIFSGLNQEGIKVSHIQEYQQDYEDAGFVFTGTPADGDVVVFECTVTEDHTEYSWERIDVQPHAEIGRYLSAWNCATGLAVTNPPESPYTYKTGDYFTVGTIGTTNYKPSGSQYIIGQASSVVESGIVSVNDTYLYDGTNWILLKTGSTVTSVNGQTGDISTIDDNSTSSLTESWSAYKLNDTIGNIETLLQGI